MSALAVLLFLSGLVEQGNTSVFSLDGHANIMAEEHFGIINGKATVGVNYTDVVSVRGVWAPPYVSSDYALDLRVSGEAIPASSYSWLPFEVWRSGSAKGLSVSSASTLIYGHRGGLVTIGFRNESDKAQEVPISVSVSGTLDRTDTWEFARAESKSPAARTVDGGTLVMEQGPCVLVTRTELNGATWNAETSAWNASVSLEPGKEATFHVAFALGGKQEALDSCAAIMSNPQEARASARKEFGRLENELFERLPRFSSNNESLVRLYNRSLVHFITNRWDVPEFRLHRYYSTGSIRGGCVCDYLWNFGEVWEILPLFDPEANREHIKQFLKIDLTKHFAFLPVTGEGFGPWYPVNQEKIIGLIYFYVKNTGDLGFLDEQVEGKSVYDWVILNAMYGDDPVRAVELIDYGPSNSHLELRRGYPYNHVMPDLNGRRYWNYLMAAQLAEASGKPAPPLRERAAELKSALKERLWNPELKWFHFLNEKGEKDSRLTVQMFKLFGSGVLDAEEEAGLLSHLNEKEFLSEQGLHSMSKTDIAYDQVDIDNGGGGICTSFVPQIAERFYKSGHASEADDLFRRTLWWGERMPYWGDSLVANAIDYRRDTPLQCTVDGVAVAQCIIFGMFGVDAGIGGDIVFHPHAPDFASTMRLEGVRIRGVAFNVSVADGAFSVASGDQSVGARIGETVRWNAGTKRLVK